MHRLIWGIVIAVFGILGFASAGSNPEGPEGSIVLGILCLAGGGTMIFFGSRYLGQRRSVAEFALQMLRSDDKINAGELAQRLGISEIKIRQHIAQAQRKGLIPFKADIV
jgi:hypothetical protein